MSDEGAQEKRETPPLFEFLLLLAVALGRRKITGPQASVAIFVALTSRGTTGERAQIKAARIATELGLSERQVWRHFRALLELGWFKQTEQPKRSKPGERARFARYRLTPPALDLSLDTGNLRVTPPAVEASHGSVEAGQPSDTFDPNRLTLSDLPSDIPERESGTVTPSHGSPSHVNPVGASTASTTGRARDDETDVLLPDGRADRDATFLAASKVSVTDRRADRCRDEMHRSKAVGQ